MNKNVKDFSMKRVFTNQNQFYNVKADGKHKKTSSY